jgi:lipopolysaccharide/colanic/teichoic acid biosynthesis glycosyltransferase
MDPLVTILVASLGLLSAALSRQLSDEFKAWAPSLAKHLIARAVRKLPEQQRARYLEEWSSDVDDTPGEIGKILKAFGYGRATTSMAAAFFGAPAYSLLQELPKRAFDLLLAVTLLAICAPAFIAAAVAVFVVSPGHIFEKHERVGRYGSTFSLLKFRTRRIDAEGTTRVGAFMGAFCIDELPQIINVLRGEMSFVGTRPERPEYAKQLSDLIPDYLERHWVRPGISGLAQVNYPYGASIADARKKSQYDLEYVRNRRPFIDARILVQTVWIVVGVPRIFRALGLTRKGPPRT